MKLPAVPNRRRRNAAIFIAVFVSIIPLACNFITRGPDFSGMESSATQEAGRPLSTREVAGSETNQAPNSTAESQAPLVLESSLPRSFRYAGIEFSLQRAAITSQPPEGTGAFFETGAYAQTVWRVTNQGRDAASIPQGFFTLQLGNGTQSKQAYGDYLNAQDSRELNLVFNVPEGSNWENASITFDEPGKVPAVLPLQGEVPTETYPQALNISGEVSVTNPPMVFTLEDGAVDLDGMGTRAEESNRYLLLNVAATCKERYDCFVGPDSFRVIIDGTPFAAQTIDPVAEAVETDTTQPFRLAFQIPEGVTQLELQVGEIDRETALIPISLSAGQ